MSARILAIAVLQALALLACGCASVSTAPVSRAKLQKIQFIRIEPLPNDQHGMDKLIAADLKSRGFDVEIGTSQAGGRRPDAILCYQDKWMWDLSMYLLCLDVQLRSAKTRVIVAQGQSFQPSLERKPPEFVVHRLLDDVIGPRTSAAPPSPAK